MDAPQDLPYRPCVGVMLTRPDGQVFVGRRSNMVDAWQMPQGGIDPGEDVVSAALRELSEEVGTSAARVVAVTPDTYRYDLPSDLIGKVWGGRWRGQDQRWVLMRFTGTDGDIRLDAQDPPEFDDWMWVTADRLIDLIVPFKREVYAQVLDRFRPLLTPPVVLAFDHVLLTVPQAVEREVLGFYGGLLGLTEVRQPEAQRARGGGWFALGEVQLHVKPDDAASEGFPAGPRRHIALRVHDLDAVAAALTAAGHPLLADPRPNPGQRRLFTIDPGGNRLELIEARAPTD